MAGRIGWGSYVVSKFDEFWLSKREYENRESAREGGWNIFIGTALMIASIMNLITGEGGVGFSLFLLFISIFSLKIGIGNLRLYKRYVSGNYHPEIKPDNRDLTILNIGADVARNPAEAVSGKTTNELATHTPSQPGPPSVTEHTTQLFDDKAQRKSENP